MGAIIQVPKSVWLYAASVVSLVAALLCSESIDFRGFWPEFGAVLSLGLLVTSLIWSVEESEAEGKGKDQERVRHQ